MGLHRLAIMEEEEDQVAEMVEETYERVDNVRIFFVFDPLSMMVRVNNVRQILYLLFVFLSNIGYLKPIYISNFILFLKEDETNIELVICVAISKA